MARMIRVPYQMVNDSPMTDSVPAPVVTRQAVTEFAKLLFALMSEKYGGETTLNEIRCVNAVLSCHLKGKTCSVSCLIEMTGIPRSTCSRSVGKLIENGWLREEIHPEDRRRRVVRLGEKTLARTGNDMDNAVQWINDARSREFKFAA